MEKVIKTFKILVTELVFFCERSDKRLHVLDECFRYASSHEGLAALQQRLDCLWSLTMNKHADKNHSGALCGPSRCPSSYAMTG